MEIKKILGMVDHTLLLQTAVWDEIRNLCDEAMEYETASVCIPASYVKRAKEYMDGRIPVCTVIGFPNGYSTMAVKVFETEDAIANGAEEIDMVINLGDVKESSFEKVEAEIKAVKTACKGKLLKIIIETCLLTEEEIIKMCEVVTSSGADFIKTSTGFAAQGATFKDVELFAKHVGAHVQIKAAGGISSLEDAEKFIELGATRLGTSRIVKLVRQEETLGY